jgi:hypothetical protein
MTNYSCQATTRQFSSAEVEHITGVTQATQRDWRRRGFLSSIAGGGRAKYDLDDLIEIATLAALTQAGLPVSQAAQLAGLAILPVISNFLRWDDVYAFIGDEVSRDEKSKILSRHVVGVSGDDNWLFASLGRKEPIMGRTDDLRKLDGGLRGSKAAVIVDLTALAREIASQATLPLITFEIEAED